jgi:hypothetical protein
MDTPESNGRASHSLPLLFPERISSLKNLLCAVSHCLMFRAKTKAITTRRYSSTNNLSKSCPISRKPCRHVERQPLVQTSVDHSRAVGLSRLHFHVRKMECSRRPLQCLIPLQLSLDETRSLFTQQYHPSRPVFRLPSKLVSFWWRLGGTTDGHL